MTEPTESADTATFRIGYKNILGSNWTRWTHPWFSRAPLVRRELLGPDGMRASIYFLGEVNRGPEHRSLKRMLPGWDVVRSASSNNAYSDPRKHRVVEQREMPLPSGARFLRRVTIVSYEHIETGIRWTAATTHLTSSHGTTAELARSHRTIEARALVDLARTYGVDVIAADLNNSMVRADTPRGILQAAGFTDWRSLVEVANVEYNTHHQIAQMPDRHHKHIDAFYFGSRITALSGRVQITEPDSSDHFGLVCTISVKR